MPNTSKVNIKQKTLLSLADYSEWLQTLSTKQLRAMSYIAAVEPAGPLSRLLMLELDAREVLQVA